MSKSVRSIAVLAGLALSLCVAGSAAADESSPAPARQAGRGPASVVDAEPAVESRQAAPTREEAGSQDEGFEELPRQILPRRWYNY